MAGGGRQESSKGFAEDWGEWAGTQYCGSQSKPTTSSAEASLAYGRQACALVVSTMLDIWQICGGKGEYEDGLQRGQGPLNEMKHHWELDSQRTVVLDSIVFANALMYILLYTRVQSICPSCEPVELFARFFCTVSILCQCSLSDSTFPHPTSCDSLKTPSSCLRIPLLRHLSLILTLSFFVASMSKLMPCSLLQATLYNITALCNILGPKVLTINYLTYLC